MRNIIIFFILASLLLSGCARRQEEASPASHLVETGVNPESWRRVPAGEFLSGQHEHPTVVDNDYEMMVTPVTNAQFARFLNDALASGDIQQQNEGIFGGYPRDVFHAGKHEVEIPAGDYLRMPLGKDELRLAWDGSAYAPLAGYENHLVTMVTWFGAKAYCQFYGWRLPAETEWEKAARGASSQPFPWGDSIGGQYANYYASLDPYESLAGKLGDTTPVGYYNGQTYAGFTTLNAASPYGLYDMAGNVWQWTADVYEGQHYRYLRGGSKADYGYNLRGWTRNSAAPDYFSPNAGLRCARDAED